MVLGVTGLLGNLLVNVDCHVEIGEGLVMIADAAVRKGAVLVVFDLLIRLDDRPAFGVQFYGLGEVGYGALEVSHEAEYLPPSAVGLMASGVHDDRVLEVDECAVEVPCLLPERSPPGENAPAGRLNLQRGVVVVERGLEVFQGQPRIAPFHEPPGVVRYDLEGGTQVADRLLVVGHPLVDFRPLRVEFRVVGVARDRLGQVLRRLVENSDLAVDGSAVMEDLFVVGVELHGLFEMNEGVFVELDGGVGRAPVEVRLRVLGVEAYRFAEVLNGASRLPKARVLGAAVRPREGTVRPDLDGGVVALEGFVVLAEP